MAELGPLLPAKVALQQHWVRTAIRLLSLSERYDKFEMLLYIVQLTGREAS